MNVLEKILEEIEEKIKLAGRMMVEKPCDKLDEIANDTAEAFIGAYEECSEIIRSHMDETPNNEWIPTSERLPNEEEFVKAYCRNHYCAEFIVMIEGATRPTTLYYKNGIWADETNNHYRVVAWQPFPEPYRPEEDKKGFIVTDIPETCLDCQFCFELDEGVEACCSITDNPNDTSLMREIDKDYCQEKPDWCPIRELPDKKPLYAENGDRPLDWEFNVGWNSCITNMEGGAQ